MAHREHGHLIARQLNKLQPHRDGAGRPLVNWSWCSVGANLFDSPWSSHELGPGGNSIYGHQGTMRPATAEGPWVIGGVSKSVASPLGTLAAKLPMSQGTRGRRGPRRTEARPLR